MADQTVTLTFKRTLTSGGSETTTFRGSVAQINTALQAIAGMDLDDLDTEDPDDVTPGGSP